MRVSSNASVATIFDPEPYSMTFNNDLSVDPASFGAYQRLRFEMREQPVSYVFETLNPGFDIITPATDLEYRINDTIIHGPTDFAQSEVQSPQLFS